MELSEMIKIMQHYETHNLNGGEVECVEKGNDNWRIANDPSWNWHDYTYRIKEQKQKVTIEKWLIKDVNSSEHLIIESSDVDKYKLYEKVKLIKSYEVEL